MITYSLVILFVFKQVYQRLQKVNVCMSHIVTCRLLESLGDGHDKLVLQWRDNLIESLKKAHEEVCLSYTI